MGTSKNGFSDWESRARKSQQRSSKHESGHFEFLCDACSTPFAQSELRIQHGLNLCAGCYEPGGDAIDRDHHRAMAAKYAAQRDAQRRLPKQPYQNESAPWIVEFTPNPVILQKHDIFGSGGTQGTLVIDGGDLDEVDFLFPLGVVAVSQIFNSDNSSVTFVLEADTTSFAGEFPIYADGEKFPYKVTVLEDPVDPDQVYLRLDGTNNGVPLTWLDEISAGLTYVPLSRQILVAGALTQNITTLAGDMVIGIDSFTDITGGIVGASGGGTLKFLRADGQWALPPGSAVFTPTASGIVPASGGGTANYLRADGTWSTPAGGAGSWDGGTITNPIDAADGTEALPAYAFSSVQGLGVYADSAQNRLQFAAGGIGRMRLGNGNLAFRSDLTLTWTDGAISGGLNDLNIKRMSIGLLGVLGLTTGNAAVRVYGDGTTGAKYIQLQHNGTDAILLTSSGLLKLSGGDVVASGSVKSEVGGFIAPIGTKAAPAYGTSGTASGTGIYFDAAGRILSSVLGVTKQRIGAATVQLASDCTLSFSNNVDTELGSPDTYLKRNSSGVIDLYGATAVAALRISGDMNAGAKYIQVFHNGGTPTITADTGIAFTKAYYATEIEDTYSTTMTIDFALSNCHFINATGSITSLTLSNEISGGRYIIRVYNNAASITIAWPAEVVWPNGVVPTPSAMAKSDIYTFLCSKAKLFGAVVQGF